VIARFHQVRCLLAVFTRSFTTYFFYAQAYKLGAGDGIGRISPLRVKDA